MTLGALAGRQFMAVIFDLDGTLVDSSRAVVESWSTVAAEYGRTFADLGEMHGVPARDLVRRLVPEQEAAAALARVDELELADLDGVVALPGADRALRLLPPDRLAIATSGQRALAEARLRAARLHPPAVMVTADDVMFGKPSSDPFMIAARRIGVLPEQCLAVEDSVNGLTAARSAGCATIAVATTTDPALLDADVVVPDLSHVRWQVGDLGIEVHLPTPA